jgi:membrane protein
VATSAARGALSRDGTGVRRGQSPKVAWRDVFVGALFTAVFFSVGQILLGVYLGHSAFATKYGAGGAVLLILLWVYYSGLILFLGAELTQVYANRYGSHVKPNKRARTLQEGVLAEQDEPDVEGTRGSRRKERGTT